MLDGFLAVPAFTRHWMSASCLLAYRLRIAMEIVLSPDSMVLLTFT